MSASRVASALAATAVLLGSASASAYCRTTTCDPNKPQDACQLNGLCVVSGIPLAWASNCVTVGVHDQGSPRNGLSYEDIAGVVEQAFATWQRAECKGGTPSIEVNMLGPLECGASEYNSKKGNANIVLFREDAWPYPGATNAIGLTTTRFSTKTGELWDADIELNGVGASLTIGDPIRGDDLLSVLTHEAGHFLGLSHSSDPTATMKSIYEPTVDGDSFRSLAPDDVEGICAIYPPGRVPATDSCDNRHGFSAQCGVDQPEQAESSGCSVSTFTSASGAEHGNPGLKGFGLIVAIAGVRLARRKRIV